MIRLYNACKVQSLILPTASETVDRREGLTAFRWFLRLLHVWGEKTGMLLLFASVMMGLVWLDSYLARPDQGVVGDDYPGAGIVVRSKQLHLWLPETVRELASPQSQVQTIRDHKDLRRFLESRHQESLRYAVTTRAYQANGGHSDITFIRRPYEDPHYFQEFLEILGDSGGKQDDNMVAGFLGASVHMIPKERLNRSPSEMITEQQVW